MDQHFINLGIKVQHTVTFSVTVEPILHFSIPVKSTVLLYQWNLM